MLGLTFSSKLNWGSYIISIAKTASQKIGALICSMKFLSSEVALYLYKSNICPCIEYCCHVWAGAPNCHLELLDKLQKEIFRTDRSIRPILHLQLLLNLWLIFLMWPAQVLSIYGQNHQFLYGVTSAMYHQNPIFNLGEQVPLFPQNCCLQVQFYWPYK